MTLGSGLVYDNGYIGRNDLPYALNVSKKVGATDLNVIAAKTNYQNGIENDKFYTIQGSYAVTPETNRCNVYSCILWQEYFVQECFTR